MAAIVGVHGIKNEQLGRNSLIDQWAPSLADGLERAIGHPVAPPVLNVAFYGDVFLHERQPSQTKDVAFDDDLVDLSAGEVDDLTAISAEAVGDEDLLSEDEVTANVPDKGLWLPVPVQRLVRSLDRRFGSKAASRLFLGEVRQVRRYLLEVDLQATADQRISEAVGADTRVLIAHSLGSVVAFEYLRRTPERNIDLLVTLGSPLGLRTIRAMMPDPAYGSQSLPANLGRWVNLWDVHDPVACAGGLASIWPGVIDDDSLNNGTSAHSITSYLSKRQTGAPLLDVLPHLGTAVIP